jgi:hypothetical protein
MRKLGGILKGLIFIVILLLIISLFFYAGYRVIISEHRIFSLSFLALIAGLLFESFRLSDRWINVIFILIGAIFFSLFGLLPGKHEHNYEFENHLQTWPYFFLFFFTLFSAIFHGDKTIVKLTEGITLIQSLSVIYWVVDYGFSDIDNWYVQSLIIIALIFSTFSILNALTYFILSGATRFILSIWSSIIMLLFAIDNIFKVYQNQDIESTSNIFEGIYIGLQFFLLGVSSMYIVQNIILLFGFLPGKGSFFNSKYFMEIGELKDQHLNRYSDVQVLIGHSILCILFTCAIYWINYQYHFLPTLTMIWIGLAFFPLILSVTNLKRKRKYNSARGN